MHDLQPEPEKGQPALLMLSVSSGYLADDSVQAIQIKVVYIVWKGAGDLLYTQE